ncbi:YciI family protein [Streptomyces sp. NPDC055099]
MNQYLISVYQPDGGVPEPEILEPIMRDVEAVNAELKEAGAWVFAGGLFPPSTATVLRLKDSKDSKDGKDSEVLTTDGPYVEGKEHLGGFTVIRAADLDEALAWGAKVARAITLPVEVRPLQSGTC